MSLCAYAEFINRSMFNQSTNIRHWLTLGITIAIAVTASCTKLPTVPQASLASTESTSAQSWQKMTAAQKEQAWQYILNSPLGVAALNQLAIEGFISPSCPKTFYTNAAYDGFQFLLRVKCPTARGVSTAVDYGEMRVTFNRFEDNIESFQVERVSSEKPPAPPLPD